MIDVLPSQEKSWLGRFFFGRNALHWEAIVGGSAPAAWLEQVNPWIATFVTQDYQSPIVLPVFDADGPSHWYAMASNEASAVALVQELTAVVGPSYSDFHGQPLQVDCGDEIECALQKRFGRFVFCLRPVNAAARSDVTQSLQLYLSLLRRRPDIPDRTQRPFGKIRAEFDRALLAGNEADAQRLRHELVASGRIDVEQHKYLDIRMLAGLGRQHQLAHDYSLIKSVLGLSLPAQTITDLVEALYATYIAAIEDDPNVEAILTVFRNDIARHFGPLFKERKGVRQPNVLKAFLLHELVQDEPNMARCGAIAAAYPAQAGPELIEYWSSRLVSAPSLRSDVFELARQALADDDYELALQLSFESFPSAWTYSAMLRCAVELEDIETTRRVLEAVGNAPEAARATWTKRDLSRLQQLQSEPSEASQERPDTDWMSWVRYVEAGRCERPPLQILEEALTRWSAEAYASDPEACRQLAEKIGNASGEAECVFRDAFGALVEFFVDRLAHPVRGFIPLYTMLIRIVAWNGVVSANELELASALIQALVSLGPSKDDYVEALDAYSEIITANSTPGNIDWALNAAEMLALHGSPDSESRLRLFMAVVELARTQNHRLKPTQHAILSLLAKDYSCTNLLESFSFQEEGHAETAHADFDGLIGIYTLTESAGQRARQFLRMLLPLARVELNADVVATDRLKHLAVTADIFVFAWRSSKHQAYYAAKEARGDLQTLLPMGKGSASILSCVLTELERLG
ncbi:protein DpdD [Pseudomonas sp. YuFO8]|uniref:protein DpdD n=1 Tax=Pseudomonas sp. YuFO8 TaxID=3095361 RepID=UPI002B250718|nr:protein DpdD [Pseudomonas sp. YuFO8]MEB2621372.1 protein DpdD [Pseudomonas sp. YuFO8]